MEQNNSNNEIQALKAENQLIKQQLQELNNLRNEAAEARYLRTQLSELDPLRKKAAEADMLKAQLSELNSLKIKFEELKKSKAQLNEMNNLRNEFEEINALRKQLNELNNMRNKALEDNNLKERINELEQIKSQYEQELNFLRNSHTNALIEMNNKLRRSSGMDSKQLYFEDKPLQIAVKGDIIHSAQELELLTRQINKSNRKITLNLLYKATADSDKAEAFHKKCDRAQSTLVLIETDKGRRFGGFTTKSWAGECQEKKDEEAFVFSLDKMMIYEIIPDELAIGCYPKFGPIFLGCQIRIYDNAFIKGGTTFEKGMNYNTEEDYELTGGDREFMVREIEVYEVIPS
jgi:DNA repair exonuclease SbcCD ATPase subunit